MRLCSIVSGGNLRPCCARALAFTQRLRHRSRWQHLSVGDWVLQLDLGPVS
jgi:hypothetical protein